MGLAASRQEAFWEACGFGDKIKVKKYIMEGVDVNWISYTHNSCPIHVASQGKKEIVQMLLDAKCKIDARDDRGNLALHHAAMNGHADIIEMLIKAGSDVDAQDKNGWTPLINAAYFCKLAAVEVLLKNRCSVIIQNQDMRSALHEACRSPSNKEEDLGRIAELLIEAGSDLNSKSSDKGEADFTPLMFCAYHGHPKVAQVLIQAGCEINAQGSNKWTALHWAADRNHLEVARVLVYSGVDVLVKGLRGELAMDRAQNKGVYSLLQKAVEDASYNFDDPDRDTQTRLKDISTKIFKTADVHKHMVERQMQMLEDEDVSSATATTTPTDVDDEGGDDKDLSTFDPESKINKRDASNRFSCNSASRLSLILNNSVSPFSSPPPCLVGDDGADKWFSPADLKSSSVGFRNVSTGNLACDNVNDRRKKMNHMSPDDEGRAGRKLVNGYIK